MIQMKRWIKTEMFLALFNYHRDIWDERRLVKTVELRLFSLIFPVRWNGHADALPPAG